MVAGQALVVEGAVPDEPSLKRVSDILALFSPDTQVRSLVRVVDPAKQQIMVRVRVLDIRIAEMQRLGLTWGDLAGGDLRVPNYSWVFEVLDFDHADNIYTLGARLSALEEDNAARVLAQPNLLVNDGEKADIHVGGEIPIPVPSVGPTGTTVTIEYKPYGVQLEIEPEITPDGRIRLRISPEVSAIDPAQSVVVSGLSIPAFRTRRTTTTVDVRDGETLAIGGLIQHEQSQVVNRVPFLSSLPIIGELFKHREWQEGKTELVVLVSPLIVTDQPPREGIQPLGDTELPPG